MYLEERFQLYQQVAAFRIRLDADAFGSLWSTVSNVVLFGIVDFYYGSSSAGTFFSCHGSFHLNATVL